MADMYVSITRFNSRPDSEIELKLEDENGLCYFNGMMTKNDYVDAIGGVSGKKIRVLKAVSSEEVERLNRKMELRKVEIDLESFGRIDENLNWMLMSDEDKVYYIIKHIPKGWHLKSDGLKERQSKPNTHIFTVMRFGEEL